MWNEPQNGGGEKTLKTKAYLKKCDPDQTICRKIYQNGK